MYCYNLHTFPIQAKIAVNERLMIILNRIGGSFFQSLAYECIIQPIDL